MEAGWIVSEVGRQPWIVYNKMRVEDAATTNTGVWITFIAVAILYVGLGITTDPGSARDESPLPGGAAVRRGRRPVRAARTCRDRDLGGAG